MSLNLGNVGCNAAHSLRSNPGWDELRAALRELASAKMNVALDAAPDNQATACGYARAMRDMWVALEAATAGVNPNSVKKPGVKE